MGILLFTALGLSVGLLARGLYPGRESMGFVTTSVLGTIGSFVGGPLANLLADRPLFDLNVAGFIGAVLCGVALLIAVGAKGRRRGLV
jgi:uncharacterized membrane protein YeaQ/YmgE (transglycosylase-associated protein family)